MDLIAELAARDRVVGLKNDDHPFYYYYDLCRATQDLDFAVLSGGQMRNFVLGYQLGSTGYLCTTAQVGWLRGIKTALYLYGLLPSDRVGGTWAEGTSNEREAVGRILTEVFGPIEKVGL